MRRAGASLLVGGNTNLVVYRCVCVRACVCACVPACVCSHLPTCVYMRVKGKEKEMGELVRKRKE